MVSRVSTGLPKLDDVLGGELLPGTLAVVYGATGIGKTRLGLTFAHDGLESDGPPGLVFDCVRVVVCAVSGAPGPRAASENAERF